MKKGKTGKTRSRHLKKVADEIGARGEGIVRLAWVKAHMGILGNEAACASKESCREGTSGMAVRSGCPEGVSDNGQS